MQDIFRCDRRIGQGGPRLAIQAQPQGFFDVPRAPLVMPTPFRRQNGIIDVMPSLLLSTLAITVVALPIGERSTDLAPRTPPKIQVQAEQQEPSPLQRGIVDLALPVPSTAAQLGPQQHYAVTFEHPPNLLRKLLPDFAAIGKQVSDSSPPQKAAVILENPRALIRLPLPDFAAIGDRRTESAPIVKYAVEADNWPSQLTTGIPAAVANPIPPGLQIGDSSPPKYAIQAQQYPTLIRVTLPDFAPVGIQLHDHETKPRYEVIALATPNLTLSTLIPPAGALPVGIQLSDSVWTVYEHSVTQIDDFQSLLALNPPPPPIPVVPIPPAAEQPAGRKLHLRTIYRVAVDTQVFEFKSLADAIRFLERTKELAREYALRITREATEKQRQTALKLPLPKLPPPAIEASSRVLRAAVQETKREIDTIYRQALIDAEIALLMELDARSEHNEDVLLLFLT